MAKVLSIVTYNIFPAKQGGQFGISLFNKFFSQEQELVCFTVKSNLPSFASYTIINELSESQTRYFNPFYFFRLRQIIKQHQISHLIIEHPYYGWMAFLLKHFCKIKVIVHSHNIEAERFKSTGKWWWKILAYYEKWVHNMANFTFCISQEDRAYFLKEYKIPYTKSAVITYGIPFDKIPNAQQKEEARNFLLNKYGLKEDTVLFFFNGSLQYLPNLNAVQIIIDEINPRLLLQNLNYKIIICGKGLPPEMNDLKDYVDKNIIYAGFVEDISVYYKGVDVFLNPVVEGGGIKTKLVEALGNNLDVVSTKNGAFGVDPELCNQKLSIVENEDWQGFVEKMISMSTVEFSISDEYFKHFYWKNIASKAAEIINKL
ncbi:MAG: glycosyltransferase family 4 protein [Ginsengibacter sp.]|jgi:glycosyltransferase involved in cell wall biosynthesis